MTVRIYASRLQARHVSACPSRQKRDGANSAKGKRRTDAFDSIKFTGAVGSLLEAPSLHRARSYTVEFDAVVAHGNIRSTAKMHEAFGLLVYGLSDVSAKLPAWPNRPSPGTLMETIIARARWSAL
jgi:hypothetical protein